MFHDIPNQLKITIGVQKKKQPCLCVYVDHLKAKETQLQAYWGCAQLLTGKCDNEKEINHHLSPVQLNMFYNSHLIVEATTESFV